MKLESKVRVSLSKRADHVVLRKELAPLGSKSQLTEVIGRFIADGHLARLSPGIYVKTILGPSNGVRLAASPQVIAQEIHAKTGRTACIRQVESPAGRPIFEAQFLGDAPSKQRGAASAERRPQRRRGSFKVPTDVAQLPVKDVGLFVANLAKANGVVFKRTRLDDFAEAITRLAGDNERLDTTGKLLAALRKKAIINGSQLARLMTNHMREQRDGIQSVRGLQHGRLPEEHRG